MPPKLCLAQKRGSSKGLLGPSISMPQRAAPQFQLRTRLSPDTVLSTIDRQLRTRSRELCGISAPGRIELHVAQDRQNLWSPRLVVEMSSDQEGTHLVARFGRYSHTGSMYVAGLAVAAFTCLVGMSFGYAQLVIGDTPTGFLVLPCAALMLMLVAMMDWAGKQLARAQRNELRAFLESSLSSD
jgi:hypothetical protein